MIPAERGIRMRLVAAARRLSGTGANVGTSGNLSARVENGYIITPSSLPYDTMHPEDLVFMGMDWTHGGGQRTPSSEWRLHRDLYARHPEAAAIVHTHSLHATALAVHGRGIPAFHYEVALAGGEDIRCARYATFGTQELSDAVTSALEGRKACLLAHHGVVALGASVENALALAEKVEFLAHAYAVACQLGDPPLLDADEMRRVVARYGAMPR